MKVVARWLESLAVSLPEDDLLALSRALSRA